ncbi:MAG TPA: hypothetical protein VGK00_02760 [Anaerolineales bacterium]
MLFDPDLALNILQQDQIVARPGTPRNIDPTNEEAASMLQFITGAFLLIHGFIVSAQSTGGFKPGPGVQNPAWLNFWPTALGQSWLLSRFGLEKTLSWVSGLLWLAGGLLLVAAGLSVFGFIIPQSSWRILAVTGAAISLFMLAIYLHPFFGVGMLASVIILVALLWAHWPPVSVIGA